MVESNIAKFYEEYLVYCDFEIILHDLLRNHIVTSREYSATHVNPNQTITTTNVTGQTLPVTFVVV